MKSLYTIKQNLLEVLNHIEENDGILEEEDELLLKIAEDNFELKLEEYRQVITLLEGDINTCKAEEARIKAFRQSKEKAVERIKKEIIDAVNQFGDINKSGNRFVETPTCKFMIRNSQAVEYDDKRSKELSENVMSYITELRNSGVLTQGEVPDWQGILDAVNKIAESDSWTRGNEFIPYTIDDLLNVKFNTSVVCTIQDIFNSGATFVDGINTIPGIVEVDSALSNTDVKNAIKNNAVFSFADIKTNQSVTIK